MTRPTTSPSRLFIAVLVPATLREEIMNMISELRDVSGDDVRWINEQNLHITLKFFGEIKTEKFFDLFIHVFLSSDKV